MSKDLDDLFENDSPGTYAIDGFDILINYTDSLVSKGSLFKGIKRYHWQYLF